MLRSAADAGMIIGVVIGELFIEQELECIFGCCAGTGHAVFKKAEPRLVVERACAGIGVDGIVFDLVEGIKRLCPETCLLYTSPSPRDLSTSRMPSSA